jgi:hypothetical protein
LKEKLPLSGIWRKSGANCGKGRKYSIYGNLAKQALQKFNKDKNGKKDLN